jgi:single stranded DNA-binding protein
MGKIYNKTIVIGRLGNDPEFDNAKRMPVSRFNLCNSTINNGHEEVAWHRIVCCGNQAVLCRDNLHKGYLCCIEGILDEKKYELNGEQKFSMCIVAERIVFLSASKRENKQ